jgi:hypothetical protein
MQLGGQRMWWRRLGGAAVGVLALVAVAVLWSRHGGRAPGPVAAAPVPVVAPADLDRARLCLQRAADPGKTPQPVRAIRLKHSDSSGDVLVVETAQWEWYCQFDRDGEYHGVFASGTVLFPPEFLVPTDPGAPIKRLSSTVPASEDPRFEDAGRISAAVAAVRVSCPGVAPVPATVSGSMYYGRITVPRTLSAADRNACAAEALDRSGAVLGRSHF